MRILLINTFDQRGGAARATWRLFEGLRAAGAEVNLLVQERQSPDRAVISTEWPVSGMINSLRPYIDFAIPLLHTRKRILFSTSMLPDRVARVIDRINPDIVHLNWITGGFIKIESLAKIDRPVIWTLHDMWAFTGGCHNIIDCTRFMQSCGKCPILHSANENDLSRKVFLRKQKAYAAMKNLTITTPSSWLQKLAQESPLLRSLKVEVVPNGLDTNIYKPRNKWDVRQQLGLPVDKRLILFGAIRGVNNPIKGFPLLLNALGQLDQAKYELLIFGSDRSAVADTLEMKTHFFGSISEESMLVDLYNAADLVAVPSYQEVFGQTASEAMACGTPVLAFGQSGLLDIVKHCETGYLATPYDPAGLVQGITWIFEDDERYQRLCAASRTIAVERFDSSIVASRMLKLYQESIGVFARSSPVRSK